VLIAVGKVFVAGLLTVVASKEIEYHVVYVSVSMLGALYTAYAFFFMKDVVKSKEFAMRR
jgi:hypothetical protein